MSPRPSSRPGSAAQRTDPEAARAAAVSLLARRDLASGELRARLAARGFAPDAAQEAVQGLVREGVVNDERYARNYVAYHARRGQGPVRISLLLRGLGVDAALTEAALADGPDWAALARQVRQGRFGARPPADWREKARQGRFLQYRGFSSDHIRSATGADPDTGPTEP
ncbi:MAG: regulatory protein RecX [Steroidobacterales bacterium]